MKIIILGNGFDLAHGLHTRYLDFLKFCKDYNERSAGANLGEFDAEFAKLIKNNFWLVYFLYLVSANIPGDNWIDFENEINEALNILKNSSPNGHPKIRKTTHNEFFLRIRDRERSVADSILTVYHDNVYPCDYNSEEDDHTLQMVNARQHGAIVSCAEHIVVYGHIELYSLIYKALRDLTRAMEIYFLECVEKIEKRNLGISDYIKARCRDDFVSVLSFNYTHTFCSLYDNFRDGRPFNYIYLHGEASASVKDKGEQSNLVLGTGDFVEDANNPWPDELLTFQKCYQRHRCDTLAEYQYLLKCTKASNDYNSEIFIVGHSLDKTDHDILKNIFDNMQYCSITVFYHDPASFKSCINQMNKILGNRDAAMRVSFKDQCDGERGFFARES